MPKQKPKTQLATLEKHRADLTAKLRSAKSKVKAEAKQTERLKNELVGAVALKEFAANPSGAFAAMLRNLIGAGVTNATVRAELGLAPLPKRAKLPKASGQAASKNNLTAAAVSTPAPVSVPVPKGFGANVPVLIEPFHPQNAGSPMASALRGLADRVGLGHTLPAKNAKPTQSG